MPPILQKMILDYSFTLLLLPPDRGLYLLRLSLISKLSHVLFVPTSQIYSRKPWVVMLAARRATDAAASLAAGARRVPRRRLISVSLFFYFFLLKNTKTFFS